MLPASLFWRGGDGPRDPERRGPGARAPSARGARAGGLPEEIRWPGEAAPPACHSRRPLRRTNGPWNPCAFCVASPWFGTLRFADFESACSGARLPMRERTEEELVSILKRTVVGNDWALRSRRRLRSWRWCCGRPGDSSRIFRAADPSSRSGRSGSSRTIRAPERELGAGTHDRQRERSCFVVSALAQVGARMRSSSGERESGCPSARGRARHDSRFGTKLLLLPPVCRERSHEADPVRRPQPMASRHGRKLQPPPGRRVGPG